MRLRDVIAELGPCTVQGPTDIEVHQVHCDSRDVGPTDIFVAIRGQRIDGRRFVPDLNAAAIICDGPVEVRPDTTVIHVDDTRRALACAAATLAGHPARRLPVVGITGTNGKTSITWMIEAMATAIDTPTAIIGTTGHRIAGKGRPARHTTPEAPVVQRILREALDANCTMAAMEVSSIGLALNRVDMIPFSVGVFTNLSQDHLDFHGDMDQYMGAKARLFHDLMDPSGTAILNGDDPRTAHLRPNCARTWTYGTGRRHDLGIEDQEFDLNGCRASISTPEGFARLRLPLLGAHNLANAIAALGAGLALGWNLEDCLEGLSTMTAIPGRMETVENTCGITVLVDYAHSPDALRAVLSSLSGLKPSDARIWTLFGCGGDRDASKRPVMGSVATALSDHCILTSDNPRSEDPMKIIAEVRAGMEEPVLIEPDRRHAIALAIQSAKEGDIVLIAGKGHESTQTVGTDIIHLDDREVAARALRSREVGP